MRSDTRQSRRYHQMPTAERTKVKVEKLEVQMIREQWL